MYNIKNKYSQKKLHYESRIMYFYSQFCLMEPVFEIGDVIKQIFLAVRYFIVMRFNLYNA